MLDREKRSISEEKVWMKYYSEEVVNAPIPKCTCYSYLRTENADRLDSNALNFYGAKTTFRELFANIEKCANAFSSLGVKQGDLVSFLTIATPESIAALYALNKLGATANMIDPRMDVDTICRAIVESGSKILIALDLAFPKVLPIMDDIKQKWIITVSVSDCLPLPLKVAMKLKVKTDIPYGGSVLKFKQFVGCGKDVRSVEAPYVGDAVMAIAYTGGTTGFPKGAMLTNDSMNAVAYNFKYAGLDHKPGYKFLGIIPVFTSYGMVCGMHMPLCMGATLVPIPKFDPTKFGQLVKTFRPNHIICTPVFIEMLMNSQEVKGMDLSFLITLASGGDTMNEGLERKLHRFVKEHNMKYPLAQGYGMSEVSAAASFCVNDIYKRGSVGIPSVATTISIFDPETGEELGYNQVGEVCISGPTLMKGYYNRPEETAHVLRKHADGQIWVHSGDLGYMDEDGFLFIKGRVKRMITRFDGHKVFPVNMEGFVNARAEVHNCCVIGVNDREHSQGQYPMVVVELERGVDRWIGCSSIYQACQTLEERGRPVAVVAVESIPLTGSGKNDYRALEKKYADFDYTAWKL
jgi:long-chain acyl-CoA synthetase